MALVKLITTGKMELQALGLSLKQLFPNDDFEMVATSRGEPYDGFTTEPLPPVGKRAIKNLRKLVQRMATEAELSTKVFVFALDDIELANVKQPELVVSHIRDVVEVHLEKEIAAKVGQQSADRVRKHLRERCSFHFAVPMIESWLFADPMGPTHVGVPKECAVHFNRAGFAMESHRDPEDFETDDPGFQGDHAGNYSVRKKAPPWLNDERARHPKNYLRYLCRSDQEDEKWTSYKETHGGADALKKLNWGAVLQRDVWMPYARALVDDLADALGHVPAALRPQDARADLTQCRVGQSSELVLRNL